ncbi:acyl-CoA dehydrogenase family protein [Flavobacterium ardleyense]|uniref:acyl-CoA dehydrogenase family protein n=1 Tax=Flavobacterium ardleyense TaxID=2038737 RepID=UPI00298C9530|nr:acyl-CoA dehydrogenase family protein [Flavobacterium ardleyense]
MRSTYFSEEHDSFRQSLKDFLQKEVVPHIEKWEETGTIDRFIWKKFGDMGFFGINYPEAYGGMNLDLFYTVILLEELQKIKSSGFAAAMWAHAYLAMTHLNAEGDERIKQDYLAPSIAGDKIGALCISEPFGGSDVAGMKTTAVRSGDKYIINGSKTFITNGIYADYYVVAAKTSPELGNKGISIFLVDTNLKGVSATKLNKLGWRASDTAEIAFDNVEISADNLMGEEGKGFPYIMQHFAFERLIMAVNAHARAEYALDYTIDYMGSREAFGTTISKFQALRHTMVEHATEVAHCKLFNYDAVARLNQGEYVVKEASMAKLKSTKVADDTIYSCLQMLGGYGYMEEYPLARLMRDSRLGPIGGGTSEIMKEILSKMIIDKQNYQPAVK